MVIGKQVGREAMLSLWKCGKIRVKTESIRTLTSEEYVKVQDIAKASQGRYKQGVTQVQDRVSEQEEGMK